MQQRHHNRLQYFQEQSNTSRDFYVSYVSRFISVTDDTRVLEIGCGEGGNLLPFARLGCSVTGIDIDSKRIQQAVQFFQLSGQKGRFLCHDFLTSPLPSSSEERYDLILVHDVIEHIAPQAKLAFLLHIQGFLRCGGIAFFGFPAWHNPFGGHQQISAGLASKLPFIHLLPNPLYKWMLQSSGTSLVLIKELMDIKRARMTIERFEGLSASAGFTVIDRVLWFINPHYKQKFNLRARKLWPFIANLSYVRNYFTTSAFYVISKIEL